jgi:hypothetical protein
VLESYDVRPLLVGVTGGGGAADPGAVNLSRFFGVVPSAPAAYEVFTERAPFDMPFRSLRF